MSQDVERWHRVPHEADCLSNYRFQTRRFRVLNCVEYLTALISIVNFLCVCYVDQAPYGLSPEFEIQILLISALFCDSPTLMYDCREQAE